MKGWIIFLGITLSMIAGAETKSVVIEDGKLPESILDKSTEALAKASHACHIQKHLGQHTSYIRREIFPRIEEELQQVLGPQQTADGQVYFMGETVDYGDLFHVHVRDPLSLIKYDAVSLDAQFTDNQQYHLQYHTYEYLDYLILNWVNQLKKVPNAELQEWLEIRQVYVDEIEKKQGSWESGRAMVIEAQLQPLTVEQRERFAQAWHEELGNLSPGKGQLEKKIRYVDPKDLKSGSDLHSYRSIVSTLEKFRIIDPLNIEDHQQSATVYFEELDDSALVKKVIQEAESKGFQYLVNSQSQYFSKEAFAQEKNLQEQQELLKKLYEAAKKTTETDPLYMYGHAYESSYDQSSHVFVGWSGKYLFSIRYFIPCEDKEKTLAETVSETQSLGINPF